MRRKPHAPGLCRCLVCGLETKRGLGIPELPSSSSQFGHRASSGAVPPFPFSLAPQSVEAVAHRGYFGRKNRSKEPEPRGQRQTEPSEPKWAHFCHFREITHVVIKDCRVSINRQDNQCLVSTSTPSRHPWGALGAAGGQQGEENGKKSSFFLPCGDGEERNEGFSTIFFPLSLSSSLSPRAGWEGEDLG